MNSKRLQSTMFWLLLSSLTKVHWTNASLCCCTCLIAAEVVTQSTKNVWIEMALYTAVQSIVIVNPINACAYAWTRTHCQKSPPSLDLKFPKNCFNFSYASAFICWGVYLTHSLYFPRSVLQLRCTLLALLCSLNLESFKYLLPCNEVVVTYCQNKCLKINLFLSLKWLSK